MLACLGLGARLCLITILQLVRMFLVKLITRVFCVMFLMLGGSGCVGNDGGILAKSPPGKASGGSSQPKQKAQKKLAVLGGEIIVAGPKGYCVDHSSISETDTGAFVPLGACASISGNASDTAPKTLMFLTAAIHPMAPDTPMTNAELVTTARRAMADDTALAGLSGQDNSAKIVALPGKKQALITKTRRAIDHDGLGADQWRAMFLTKGHVVALSVSGFVGQDASIDGEAVLTAFLDAMQAVNPEGK